MTLSKGSRITGDARQEIARVAKKDYESGRTIRDIAANLGRSYGFVYKVLSDAQVQLRNRGNSARMGPLVGSSQK